MSRRTSNLAKPRKRNRWMTCQPGVESMEDRVLLAQIGCIVNSNLDTDVRDSVLTLREAIEVSNGDLPFATLSAQEQAQVTVDPLSSATNTIGFAIPGAGPHVISTSGYSVTVPVDIDGYSQSGASRNTLPSGENAVLQIILQAAGETFDGLSISAGNSTVSGLVIQNFPGAAISLSGSGGNTIEGNFLGTNATGLSATGTGNGSGVSITNSINNTIGGIDPANRNLISGNSSTGVSIGDVFSSGATGNTVQGNFIGTDASGALPLPNNFGVAILGTSDNTIGGAVAGSRNVISGNTGIGVSIAASQSTYSFVDAPRNTVQGNFIGLDANGFATVPNGGNGVSIYGASDNVIGGTTPLARNIISGNVQNGVWIAEQPNLMGGSASLAAGNVVQGNFIGTDASGTFDRGNTLDGVLIDSSQNNVIGGTTPGAGNLISGNNANGVELVLNGESATTGNLIQGNFIGTDASGSNPVGNTANGVLFNTFLGANNTVGGTIPGAGNTIAFNGGAGVNVQLGSGNGILSNSIVSNAGLGIDLGNDGVTLNDPSDPDLGANNLQNYPVLAAAVSGASNTIVSGTLNSTPNTSFTIQFFVNAAADPSGFGEGQTFLGQTTVTTDGLGDASFAAIVNALPGGQSVVTATATDPANNTSEFSAAIAANSFIVVNTNDSGFGSLRQAILNANLAPGLQTITFAIPGAGPFSIAPLSVLPEVTDSVVLDAATQPGYSGTPVVEVSGFFTGFTVDGLTISAGNSTVRGLAISRFRSGIVLQGAGGDVIVGNFLGTGLSDTFGSGNLVAGVVINGVSNNRIGGPAALDRNLISQNGEDGVQIVSAGATGNIVQGNYIGTDVTGTQSLGNGGGLFLDSGVLINNAPNNQIIGNVISGNLGTANIIISGAGATGNVVQGNTIGLDPSGTVAVLPGQDTLGILITDAPGNQIGGTTAGQRNIIAGLGSSGISIEGAGAVNNQVQGNYIGTNALGNTAIPNNGSGIVVDTTNTLIGGTASGAGNLIAGNLGPGVQILSDLLTASGNTVQGNTIGLAADGVTPLGNASGVRLTSSGNLIGGLTASARNIISGNLGDGVSIASSITTNNLVQGNYIGTDSTGLLARGNGVGVRLNGGAGNVIGGSIPGALNLISGNLGDGVQIQADGNTIAGNAIGVDANGAALGNSGNGVQVISGSNNTIGGATTDSGNLIAFNGQAGVNLASTSGIGNAILTNSIVSNAALGIDINGDGVTSNDPIDDDSGPNNLQNFPVLDAALSDATSTRVLGSLNSTPNTTFLIQFFANLDPDPSGFGEGQSYLGQTTVTTNGLGVATFSALVGAIPTGQGIITATATDPTNSTSEFSRAIVANSFIVVNTNDSGFGSLRQALINSNLAPGMQTILFAIPGSGPFTIAPQSELPNITDPVVIDATTQPGFAGQPIIEVAGLNAGSGANGLVILSGGAGSTVRGLVINRFGASGIAMTAPGGNTIVGNYIGTDVTGTHALGNGVHGIFSQTGSSNNRIGGTNPADRNLISGNAALGIAVFSPATGNQIVGNFIGTDVTGTQIIDPGLDGIVGTSDDLPLGNGVGLGIAYFNNLGSSSNNNVTGNNISGNLGNGLQLLGSGTFQNLVQGNFIGTDLSGTLALGNGGNGVLIANSHDNTIGGINPGEGNIISGNGGDGILIVAFDNAAPSTNNRVLGNLIGTDASGALPLPNLGHGVELGAGASNNLIGGPPSSPTNRGPSNVIAFNAKAGIFVDASTGLVNAGNGNRFSGNSIFSNQQLGIDIAPPGPNPNIPGGSTTGPNDLQNYPVLDFVFFLNGATNVLGHFNSLPNQTYHIEFFANSAADPTGFGQGQTFLGATDVTTDAQGNALLSATFPLLPIGQTVVTATATATNGSTSEFSSTLAVGPPPVDLNVVKTDAPDPVLAGGLLTYTIHVTNSGPGTAQNVTLLDSLPLGVYFVSATTSQGTIDAQASPSGTVSAQLGDLLSGGQATIQIVVRPMIAGTITNTVTVASTSPEINSENNTAKSSTVVLPAADLVLTLNAAPQPVLVGDLLTYTTVILNRGPSPAVGVSFAEAVLGGFEVVSAQSSRGPIQVVNGRIEAHFRTLIAGDSIAIVLVVRPTTPGVQFARASVNSQVIDPDPQNNAQEVSPRVNARPLLFTVTNTNDAGEGSLRQAILNANVNPDRNLIDFAIPGPGPFTISPTSPLPPIIYPAIVDAQTQPGFQFRPIVELSGARPGAAGDGLVIFAGQSTVRGLIVNRFSGNGIVLENQGENLIAGNILGTNANGAPGLGNGGSGLVLVASANNLIVGNIISGNGAAGINIQGPPLGGSFAAGVQIQASSSEGNVVQGNFIGTDPTGRIALGNAAIGILIDNSARNIIGGTQPGSGNIISGNNSTGIELNGSGATNNYIAGNAIGTDVTGTVPLPNRFDGVFIVGAPFNVVANNVISGNGEVGIQIFGQGATGNQVIGNFIGTDVQGTTRPNLGNGIDGVYINDAPNNQVSGNIVSGSGSAGIQIFGGNSRGNAVQGNVIGSRTGQGNNYGVFINGAPLNDQEVQQIRVGNTFLNNTTATLFTVLAQTPPTVQNQQAIVANGFLTAVVLTFSKDMNADRANNLANYGIQVSGQGAGVRPLSATYDPLLRNVTLVLRSPVPTRSGILLTVRGTNPNGLTDLGGRLLDGNFDGLAGGNFVTRFGGQTRQSAAAPAHRVRSTAFQVPKGPRG